MILRSYLRITYNGITHSSILLKEWLDNRRVDVLDVIVMALFIHVWFPIDVNAVSKGTL